MSKDELDLVSTEDLFAAIARRFDHGVILTNTWVSDTKKAVKVRYDNHSWGDPYIMYALMSVEADRLKAKLIEASDKESE